MRDSDKQEFFEHIDGWAARWPNQRWSDKHARAYWSALQFFDLDHVRAGLRKAAERSDNPKFIPPADVVRQHALEVERSSKGELDRKQSEAIEARISSGTFLAHVPKSPDAQKRYMEEADSQFEQFARYCECESKNSHILPNQRTPEDMAKRRFKHLNKLIDSIADDKVIK